MTQVSRGVVCWQVFEGNGEGGAEGSKEGGACTNSCLPVTVVNEPKAELYVCCPKMVSIFEEEEDRKKRNAHNHQQQQRNPQSQ